MRRIVSVFGGLIVLSACGSGGGSPTPSGPPPLAPLHVTLTPTSQALVASEDSSVTSYAIEAAYTGKTSDAIYPQIDYDKTVLAQQGDIKDEGNGKYSISFRTLSGLGGGHHDGAVTFRLCADSGCKRVYPGSAQKATYTFNVQLKDWAMYQRNASHDGYVHATVPASAISQAWEWTPVYTTRIFGPASIDGTLFLTRTNADGTTSVQALSSAIGTEMWQYNLGKMSGMSAPAAGQGKVYVSTISSSEVAANVALDAKTGKVTQTMPFDAQWSVFTPPTLYDGGLYMASGVYGNRVFAFDLASGALHWNAYGSGANIWDGETPAVDDHYVYYYSGAALDVFDRATGKLVESLPDSNFTWAGYSDYSAPILGEMGDVIAYSGSMTASGQQPRPLVGYAIGSGKAVWRSSDVYETVPAVAGGVVYVGRNQPSRLDAIDEKTGNVLWSWTPPVDEAFIGNTIATDNMLLVSTDAKVYAITLADHAVAWSLPTPGDLAIASDGHLIVAVNPGQNGAPKLVAYNLL